MEALPEVTTIRDVEVYVTGVTQGAVIRWCRTQFSSFHGSMGDDDFETYHADHDGHHVSITVTPNAGEKGYVGASFVGTSLPWSSDAECARQLVQDIGGRARCVPEDDSVYDDVWLQIDSSGEKLIVWDG